MIKEVMGPVIDIHGGGRCVPSACALRMLILNVVGQKEARLCAHLLSTRSDTPAEMQNRSLPYRDLVFPHHENELAQSRAAEGACSCGHDHAHTDGGSGDGSSSSGQRDTFVRYWVHNGERRVGVKLGESV